VHDFVFDSLLIIQDNTAVHSLTAPWELFAQEYSPPPIACLLYEVDYRRAAVEARIGIAGGWNNAVFRSLLPTADSPSGRRPTRRSSRHH
jgi:hypothetical protein